MPRDTPNAPVFGNLYESIEEGTGDGAECFNPLIQTPGWRLERIVSHGHATPEGEWYDQVQDEWVVLLKGRAGLRFDGQPEPRVLFPGDHVLIPAHCRHRVDFTEPETPTVWLALHYES